MTSASVVYVQIDHHLHKNGGKWGKGMQEHNGQLSTTDASPAPSPALATRSPIQRRRRRRVYMPGYYYMSRSCTDFGEMSIPSDSESIDNRMMASYLCYGGGRAASSRSLTIEPPKAQKKIREGSGNVVKRSRGDKVPKRRTSKGINRGENTGIEGKIREKSLSEEVLETNYKASSRKNEEEVLTTVETDVKEKTTATTVWDFAGGITLAQFCHRSLSNFAEELEVEASGKAKMVENATKQRRVKKTARLKSGEFAGVPTPHMETSASCVDLPILRKSEGAIINGTDDTVSLMSENTLKSREIKKKKSARASVSSEQGIFSKDYAEVTLSDSLNKTGISTDIVSDIRIDTSLSTSLKDTAKFLSSDKTEAYARIRSVQVVQPDVKMLEEVRQEIETTTTATKKRLKEKKVSKKVRTTSLNESEFPTTGFQTTEAHTNLIQSQELANFVRGGSNVADFETTATDLHIAENGDDPLSRVSKEDSRRKEKRSSKRIKSQILDSPEIKSDDTDSLTISSDVRQDLQIAEEGDISLSFVSNEEIKRKENERSSKRIKSNNFELSEQKADDTDSLTTSTEVRTDLYIVEDRDVPLSVVSNEDFERKLKKRTGKGIKTKTLESSDVKVDDTDSLTTSTDVRLDLHIAEEGASPASFVSSEEVKRKEKKRIGKRVKSLELSEVKSDDTDSLTTRTDVKNVLYISQESDAPPSPVFNEDIKKKQMKRSGKRIKSKTSESSEIKLDDTDSFTATGISRIDDNIIITILPNNDIVAPRSEIIMSSENDQKIDSGGLIERVPIAVDESKVFPVRKVSKKKTSEDREPRVKSKQTTRIIQSTTEEVHYQEESHQVDVPPPRAASLEAETIVEVRIDVPRAKGDSGLPINESSDGLSLTREKRPTVGDSQPDHRSNDVTDEGYETLMLSPPSELSKPSHNVIESQTDITFTKDSDDADERSSTYSQASAKSDRSCPETQFSLAPAIAAISLAAPKKRTTRIRSAPVHGNALKRTNSDKRKKLKRIAILHITEMTTISRVEELIKFPAINVIPEADELREARRMSCNPPTMDTLSGVEIPALEEELATKIDVAQSILIQDVPEIVRNKDREQESHDDEKITTMLPSSGSQEPRQDLPSDMDEATSSHSDLISDDHTFKDIDTSAETCDVLEFGEESKFSEKHEETYIIQALTIDQQIPETLPSHLDYASSLQIWNADSLTDSSAMQNLDHDSGSRVTDQELPNLISPVVTSVSASLSLDTTTTTTITTTTVEIITTTYDNLNKNSNTIQEVSDILTSKDSASYDEPTIPPPLPSTPPPPTPSSSPPPIVSIPPINIPPASIPPDNLPPIDHLVEEAPPVVEEVVTIVESPAELVKESVNEMVIKLVEIHFNSVENILECKPSELKIKESEVLSEETTVSHESFQLGVNVDTAPRSTDINVDLIEHPSANADSPQHSNDRKMERRYSCPSDIADSFPGDGAYDSVAEIRPSLPTVERSQTEYKSEINNLHLKRAQIFRFDRLSFDRNDDKVRSAELDQSSSDNVILSEREETVPIDSFHPLIENNVEEVFEKTNLEAENEDEASKKRMEYFNNQLDKINTTLVEESKTTKSTSSSETRSTVTEVFHTITKTDTDQKPTEESVERKLQQQIPPPLNGARFRSSSVGASPASQRRSGGTVEAEVSDMYELTKFRFKLYDLKQYIAHREWEKKMLKRRSLNLEFMRNLRSPIYGPRIAWQFTTFVSTIQEHPITSVEHFEAVFEERLNFEMVTCKLVGDHDPPSSVSETEVSQSVPKVDGYKEQEKSSRKLKVPKTEEIHAGDKACPNIVASNVELVTRDGTVELTSDDDVFTEVVSTPPIINCMTLEGSEEVTEPLTEEVPTKSSSASGSKQIQDEGTSFESLLPDKTLKNRTNFLYVAVSSISSTLIILFAILVCCLLDFYYRDNDIIPI